MIKRVDELKYTKQIIAEKLEERNTQKRRILIRLVDAFIVVAEDKEQFKNIMGYNKIDKKMLNIDIILNELKDDLIKLNEAKNIYNYLNNLTLKEIVLTFGDLIQFFLHAKKKITREKRKKYHEAIVNGDYGNDCLELCRLSDKSMELFTKWFRLSEDHKVLRDIMREISYWHPFGKFSLRGLNIQWLC